MKSTGIVRKIDELGRIVLPKELRKTLGIANRDELEIYTQADKIILRKPSKLTPVEQAFETLESEFYMNNFISRRIIELKSMIELGGGSK